MQCSVFAPSHITGFFEIRKHQNPLSTGSRGAGITLSNGVLTNIELTEGDGQVHILLNNIAPPDENSISMATFRLIKKSFLQYFSKKEQDIVIKHTTSVPVGAGFGVSAACALGVALGVSKLFKLPITLNKAASFAHLAEVNMGSGLGDVIAELNGGLVLRTKEGSPGNGNVDQIFVDESERPLYIISKTLGMIETSDIINNPAYIAKINKAGALLLTKLIENPSPEQFMRLSFIFAHKTGLMDPELDEIVEILKEESMGASMAMLGRTVFAISEVPDSSIEKTMISRIDHGGCRFIDHSF
jgi:pantoate kinase